MYVFILLNKKRFLHLLNTMELNFYVHSVSPLKKSGHTSYFNCSLQTKTNIYRGVCFATGKQEALQPMQKQKSAVELRNYTINTKYGTQDVVINKNTTITPTAANFEYQSTKNTSFQSPPLQTLHQNSSLLLKDTCVI